MSQIRQKLQQKARNGRKWLYIIFEKNGDGFNWLAIARNDWKWMEVAGTV